LIWPNGRPRFPDKTRLLVIADRSRQPKLRKNHARKDRPGLHPTTDSTFGGSKTAPAAAAPGTERFDTGMQ